MKKWVIALSIMAAAGLCFCDGPDQIYNSLPDDFDPDEMNGLGQHVMQYEGVKGFFDETASITSTGPTIEVCTDTELSDKWAWMMVQPIIPMVGAAGVDMRGGDDWEGLTVDEVQSKDMLCQALYVSSYYALFGDNIEVVMFYNSQTRQIDDILLFSGYEGVMETDDYWFRVNSPITKGSLDLNRKDGSNRDPRTDENMRDINRSLLRTYRPNVHGGPDSVDCVDTGSCYVIGSGTLPILVFLDLNIYLRLEPNQMRIYSMEIAMSRPFNFGRSDLEIDGVTPTMSGIDDCEITYGTTWGHILDECMGDDPLAMVEASSVNSYENLYIDLGGFEILVKRDLEEDEILAIGEEPERGDEVIGMVFYDRYEGSIDMPLEPILEIYKANLDAAIRDEVPELLEEDPTGVEKLRVPGDPDLPDDVSDRYKDRLRPGGIRAAYCDDDGPDPDTTYDRCMEDSSGNLIMPITTTMESIVTTELGTLMTPALRELTFYGELFIEAIFEYMNGEPLVPNQAMYSPSTRAERLYGTLTMTSGGKSYSIDTSFDGLDDRLGYYVYYQGSNRPESVLFRDAELPVSGWDSTGVFMFDRLLESRRIGLGTSTFGSAATPLITIDEVVPENRRAIMTFTMTEDETMTVLAPYVEASTTMGYWTPIEGAHNEFHQAEVISLYGWTINANLYRAPLEDSSDVQEVVAIYSDSFFGPITFCGQTVELGDWVEDILFGIMDADYPCTTIVRWSEGDNFLTSVSAIEDQKIIYVDNDRVSAVFAWN